MAFHAVRAGEGDVFVAAGVESISQVDGYPKDAEELHPKLFGDDAPIANVYIPMGLTAENVAEQLGRRRARTWTASRSARRSAPWRRRSPGSSRAGSRRIRRTGGRGGDDGPRPILDAGEARVARAGLQPGGNVTAGNSCPLNDGAAAVLVMARAGARVGIGRARGSSRRRCPGVAPEIMGVGPIGAVRKVLEQAG